MRNVSPFTRSSLSEKGDLSGLLEGSPESVKSNRIPTTARVVADNAQRFSSKPMNLALGILRGEFNHFAMDALATIAMRSQTSCEEFELAVRAGSAALIEQCDADATAWYAVVLAVRRSNPDTGLALQILTALFERFEAGLFPPKIYSLYLQLLQASRKRSELLREVADFTGSKKQLIPLMTDTLNPFLYPDANLDLSQFEFALSDAMDPARQHPLEIVSGNSDPFFRVQNKTDVTVDSPATVTVVMSCFNPSSALRHAAHSVIAQSWQNWELLIVDDQSNDAASQSILNAVEASDNRIRVIRKSVNGGTYLARNTAMMQARGDFVTFLDSDDWAHPRWLEDCVTPLLRFPDLLATRAYGVRVSPQLEMTRLYRNSLQPAATTIMFRRAEVIPRIGFFDASRKGADSEFIARLESAFGRRARTLRRGIRQLLLVGDSLSSSEFSPGWHHQIRWLYRHAYQLKHEEAALGRREAFVPATGDAPIYANAYWRKPGDKGYQEKRTFDAIFAGDWRAYGGPQKSMLNEIEALLSNGKRVGVMHMSALRFSSSVRKSLCRPLLELLETERVSFIDHDSPVTTDLLLFRYPPILQFAPIKRLPIEAREVIVVANQAPSEPDGSDQRYVPIDVHRIVERIFGVEPKWAPQGPVIRSILTGLLPHGVLTGVDIPTIADDDVLSVKSADAVCAGAPVIVGRYSRDHTMKFPESGTDLLNAYGFSDDYEVRMMGAERTVARLLSGISSEGSLPNNWEILEYGAISPSEFLKSLDVFVYIDNDNFHEAFGRSLLEAAASGVLVVASPKHQEAFGDALIYADAESVPSVVADYVSDKEKRLEQLRLTQQRVNERWSKEAFISWLTAEFGSPQSPQREFGTKSGVSRGELVAVRADRRREAEITSCDGEISAVSVRVRRLADAELCDSLIVVFDREDSQNAALRAKIISGNLPRGCPLETDDQLPDGVVALALSQDRDWSFAVREGWHTRVEESGAVRLWSTGH